MSGLEDRLKSLRVTDAMNRNVVVLAADDTLERAGEIFAANGVSSAPVVNNDLRCLGVLSAVDFVRREQGEVPLRVRDVMTTDVRTIETHDTLVKAAQLMMARHVHRLPVLGEDHRVVGMLSTMDLVAAVMNALDEADSQPSR